MLRDLLSAPHLASNVEQTRQPKLRHSIDQAGTAEATWHDVATDHLELDVIGQGHAFDGALGGAHPAADLAALERRSGGRRGAEHALDPPEHNLPVPAYVHKDPHLILAGDAG